MTKAAQMLDLNQLGGSIDGSFEDTGNCAAIAASGLARKQLHLTTKVWHENLEPESLHRALDVSLAKLGVDYVDLYMVHWPSRELDLGAVMETMQGFLQNGTVRLYRCISRLIHQSNALTHRRIDFFLPRTYASVIAISARLMAVRHPWPYFLSVQNPRFGKPAHCPETCRARPISYKASALP